MKSALILVGIFALFRSSYGQMCFPDEITCANLNCIPETLFCDGHDDCGDGTDEPEGCTPCPEGYWLCANRHCVLNDYICDGENDCEDWSDEPENPEDCPACKTGDWRCPNGHCVHESYICDGDNDCGDWSDETEDMCPCADDELRCPPSTDDGKPGTCIPPENICDPEGIWDCSDGSDEANCTIKAAYNPKIYNIQRVKLLSMRNKHAFGIKVSKSKKPKGNTMKSTRTFLKSIVKK